MAASASGWNAKYSAAADEASAEPAEFVRELLPLLPLGPALDLACGAGRHTLLLAARQQAVTGAGNTREARTGFALRGESNRTCGTGWPSAAWDSTLAHKSRGSKLAQASVFAGGLRTLLAAVAFRADRTRTCSRRRATVRDLHGCAARVRGRPTKPKLSLGIGRA